MTHLESGVDPCVYTPSLVPPTHSPQGPGLGWSSQRPGPSASLETPGSPSVAGLSNGDLVLNDISYKDDGLYQCTVANHVGYSVCVVEVKVSGMCSRPGGPMAGKVGWEELGLYFGASSGSAFPLPSGHRSPPRVAGKPWERHANVRGSLAFPHILLTGCP